MPPGLVLSVVRKEVHYKFVDFGQGQHLARRTVDRHVYHGYVAKEQGERYLVGVWQTTA